MNFTTSCWEHLYSELKLERSINGIQISINSWVRATNSKRLPFRSWLVTSSVQICCKIWAFILEYVGFRTNKWKECWETSGRKQQRSDVTCCAFLNESLAVSTWISGLLAFPLLQTVMYAGWCSHMGLWVNTRCKIYGPAWPVMTTCKCRSCWIS